MAPTNPKSKTEDELTAALRPLVRVLAPLVAAELANRTRPTRYSTEDPSLFPTGKRNRRQARDAIKAAGGTCTGKGRDARWSIDVFAYHAHHDRPTDVRRLDVTTTDEAIADAAYEATLRSTRRSA